MKPVIDLTKEYGLVLEGGAMRGMFTAGVMDVMMENGKIYLTASIRMIEEKFINLRGNIIITQIGNIIGSHCGSGTVGVSFLGSEREK